jgi:ParB/RepB/Spo0J family partition protein
MATKLNAGEYVVSQMFCIDPQNVEMSLDLNGRAFPHDEEAIKNRCDSYEKVGQLQPVVVRKINEHKVQLVAGYCRYGAAVEYNKRHPDKPMLLKCVLSNMNEEEAFQANIVENRERVETSPVDDAFNQRRLRDKFQWSDTKIAEFYKCHQSYVSQLKKLLMLETKYQMMVHNKTFALTAALALADLSPSEREAAIAKGSTVETTTATGEVVTTTTTPTTESVTKAVREKKIEQGKSQARSLKEVKEFFEGITGPAENPEVKKLAENVLDFIKGKITEKAMTMRLNKMFKDAAVIA